MVITNQTDRRVERERLTIPRLFEESYELLFAHLPDRAVDFSISYADQIDSTRRAMTLGVKLAHRTSLNPGDSLPYSFTALACGLHLAEIGASSEAISLGFFSQALLYLPFDVVNKHLSIIGRKFPSLVPALVELSELRGESYITNIARENDSSTTEEDLMLARSVQRVLTATDKLSKNSGDSEFEKVVADASLSWVGHAMARLHSAIELAWDAYKDVDRKRGPELQPMFRHAIDVALLVSMSGADQDLVIAGLLHDILEGYKTVDGREIPRGFYSSEVEQKFGRRVREIIETLTEPPKSELRGNWEQRKIAVLRQIEDAGRDVATVLTASKISTFSDGTKGLWAGQEVSDWSSGSHAQNVWVMNEYLKFARANNVDPNLVSLLQLEAIRFRNHNRHSSVGI